jgi:hypothetical protein
LFAVQRVLSFGAQGLGRLPRVFEQPLTLGFRLVLRLLQPLVALPVELVVLLLELVAFLFGIAFNVDEDEVGVVLLGENLSRFCSASAFFAPASASSAAIRCSRASMAARIGLYKNRFNNHIRMRKLTTWALTVNQSISMT